jgi:hypothetical protein
MHGYHRIFTDIGMGWWLAGVTAVVAGLVATLELSQISEDYSSYMNTSEQQPVYDLVEVEDHGAHSSFWERRCETFFSLSRIATLRSDRQIILKFEPKPHFCA